MSGVNAVNKVKKFRRVLVTSDPAGLDPSAVARHYKHYHDTSLEALHDLMEAVEDLLDEHGHELSAQDSDSWKAMSGKCNQEFKELMNKLEKTTKETEAVASMVPILTVPPPGTQPSAVATPGAPATLNDSEGHNIPVCLLLCLHGPSEHLLVPLNDFWPPM